MSAYDALRSGFIFTDEDDTVPQYENLDNEDEEAAEVLEEYNERSVQQTPSETFVIKAGSNFTPNDDNVIVDADNIIVGLKVNEYILLNGQCTLTIQRGAILINKKHYLHAGDTGYDIICSTAQALPIISSTQVLDRTSIKDTKTKENLHLFSSDYKSVVKLQNFYTGLQDIGKYYSPFKNMFHSNIIEEDLSEFEKLFQTYSFEIILRHGFNGLDIGKTWSTGLDNLLNNMDSQDAECHTDSQVIMVIGNKNSGKSTLTKTIANELILNRQRIVSFLDLDPGQSEFSVPYCLSLTTISKPIFGLAFPNTENNCYYGFNTPQIHPGRYVAIAKSLIETFFKYYKPKGYHLVINTPGWIKGYGKELLTEITSLANPDQLITLGGNGIEDLTFKNHMEFPGIFQTSKYSPSQLRTFNKLTYFHQLDNDGSLRFSFENHLLVQSPLRLSYETLSPLQGINLVSVLGYDIGISFDIKDLLLMIDSSIMSLYVIEEEVFSTIESLKVGYENFPRYLNYKQLDELTESKFIGLCMIHSINQEEQYFNLYLPPQPLKELKYHLLNNYKLLLIKGDGEIPTTEMLNDDIVFAYYKAKKKNKNPKIPYISWENQNRVGGIWKVRRNVMRRSHRH
ncbi:uncharacterized protein PRCAT00002100001 [Priceomyces carsonii]|uniref:uncharacterized protein n=1 Tax=Priceomyces carsonii TaxID=28549 RepID=UPI002ED87334|nr:unnamed protein product [Priceomyces carsonii]